MALYSDILLTVDYDRTLTAPDSTIPARNIDAIRYFMEEGGTFTVNTGRGLPMAACFRHKVPVNAPLLLYNGSAAYDTQKETFLFTHEIQVDQEEILTQVHQLFPELTLEFQGQSRHYSFWPNKEWEAFCDAQQCAWGYSTFGADMGPFVKFTLLGKFYDSTVQRMFEATAQEKARFQEVIDTLQRRWGDKLEIFLSADRIIDIHAKGVSKLHSARQLQKEMGKKILVCAGDADNDIAMLRGADYAFCPSDAVVARQFANVCKCGDGAVADVIYKKIPEILQEKG